MARSSLLGLVVACAVGVAAPLSLAPGALAGFSPVAKQLSEPEADVALSSEAVDSAGDTIAVWEQNSTHSPSTKLLAGRWVAADGSLGPLLSLSVAGQEVNEPRVAVGPSGSAFVASW